MTLVTNPQPQRAFVQGGPVVTVAVPSGAAPVSVFLDYGMSVLLATVSSASSAEIWAPSGSLWLRSSIPSSATVTASDPGNLSPDLDALVIPVGVSLASDGEDYAGIDTSYQVVGPDLPLAAGAGSDDAAAPKFLAAVMGNVLGDELTETANVIGGVIGAYSVLGAKATTYPAAAVMGIVMDGVDEVDAAVLAVIDGDSATTIARAAFGVMSNNSNVGSGFSYGLDLYSAAHDDYDALAILTADIRLNNQLVIRGLAVAITANVTTTSLPSGSIGITSHATGVGKLFISDGEKWQYAVVA